MAQVSDWYRMTLRVSPLCASGGPEVYASRLDDSRSVIVSSGDMRWAVPVSRALLLTLLVAGTVERVTDEDTLKRLRGVTCSQ